MREKVLSRTFLEAAVTGAAAVAAAAAVAVVALAMATLPLELEARLAHVSADKRVKASKSRECCIVFVVPRRTATVVIPLALFGLRTATSKTKDTMQTDEMPFLCKQLP